MPATIIAPPDPGAGALAELKGWLAITRSAEDAALLRLLGTAIATCEAFTGAAPLAQTAEEIHPARTGWTMLTTRPVNALLSAEGIPAEGPRIALPGAGYEFDLCADGGARFRLLRIGTAGRVAIRFAAGIAADWGGLPDPLRHGMLRLAAHLYRARDAEPSMREAMPPAAVTALWQPWRRIRLA